MCPVASRIQARPNNNPVCQSLPTQVLVYHDLLGMIQHPHHAKVTPKFCKQYAKIGTAISEALEAYHADVTQRQFPLARYSPYALREGEDWRLVEALRSRGLDLAAAAAATGIEQGKQEAARANGSAAAPPPPSNSKAAAGN